MVIPQLSSMGLESLPKTLVNKGLKVFSQDLPQKLIDATPSLLTGNRGKDYLYITRQGEKALQKGQKTFKFYLNHKIKTETNIAAADETGLTVGGEKEQEKAMKDYKLYNWKKKGIKVRSLDLVYPLRSPLLVEIADLESDSPSQFLLRSIKEVSQHVKIDYLLADAGFLNLKALKEMPVKTVIRGKSNLKGFKNLSAVPLTVREFEAKDRVYVAYRVIELDGLYYYDVVYVKGKPRHFTFVTNFQGDPYELAELYRLRWQIEEGFKVRKARIEDVRKLRNKVFLFLYYTVLDFAWNVTNYVVFGFKTPGKKPLSFDSFVKLL